MNNVFCEHSWMIVRVRDGICTFVEASTAVIEIPAPTPSSAPVVTPPSTVGGERMEGGPSHEHFPPCMAAFPYLVLDEPHWTSTVREKWGPPPGPQYVLGDSGFTPVVSAPPVVPPRSLVVTSSPGGDLTRHELLLCTFLRYGRACPQGVKCLYSHGDDWPLQPSPPAGPEAKDIMPPPMPMHVLRSPKTTGARASPQVATPSSPGTPSRCRWRYPLIIAVSLLAATLSAVSLATNAWSYLRASGGVARDVGLWTPDCCENVTCAGDNVSSVRTKFAAMKALSIACGAFSLVTLCAAVGGHRKTMGRKPCVRLVCAMSGAAVVSAVSVVCLYSAIVNVNVCNVSTCEHMKTAFPSVILVCTETFGYSFYLMAAVTGLMAVPALVLVVRGPPRRIVAVRSPPPIKSAIITDFGSPPLPRTEDPPPTPPSPLMRPVPLGFFPDAASAPRSTVSWGNNPASSGYFQPPPPSSGGLFGSWSADK